METTADVPMRAALDPTLSATALRLLVYLGAVTANGGYSWFPITEVARVLQTSVAEVRIARHQLLRLKYIGRRPRGIVDETTHLVRKHWCYYVVLVEPQRGIAS